MSSVRIHVMVVIAGLFLVSAPAFGGVARDITRQAGWRYFKGASEPAANWHTRDFDDSGWLIGAMPFRYGDGTNGTVLSDMQNAYSTLYLRYTFTNYNAIAITSMVFNADYDDAFIVWLNDVEVYRSPNVPSSLAYNSLATYDHESSAGSPPGAWSTNVLINPSEQYFIWPGPQKVSVQVFNVTLGSSDFYFDMKVVANNMFVSNAIKVACVGSSTTQGHQNVPNSFHTSYPAFLQLIMGPGYEVRNYGHNGKTTMRTLVGNSIAPDPFADNPNTPGWYHSREWQPELVCIQLGVNDAHTNRNWNGNKQNFTNEYDYLVKSYTNHGGVPTRVYCGTPPWVATNYFSGQYIGNPDTVEGWDWADDGHVSNLEIGPIIKSYAAVKGLPMIDVCAWTEGHWPEWYNAGGIDALHMSTLGHSNVALCVFDGMKTPAIQIKGNDEWLADGATAVAANDLTDFGTADVSIGTVDHTFTIQNLGASTLNLTGGPRVAIGGANASDFTVVSQPAATVAAGGSTTFVVRFDPSATGVRSATVTVANDDFTKSPFDFAIAGAGESVALPDSWRAYNDAAWHQDATLFTGQGVEDEAVNYTTNSPWASKTGALVNTNGGALSARIAFNTDAATGIGMVARDFGPPADTDAAMWFAGRVGPNNTVNWSAGTVTMTLSSLDTGMQYRVVIWSTRGSVTSGYSNRWTDITISGVEAFVNQSSAGCIKLTSLVAQDMTRVHSSSDGHVVRYDAIDCGADGSIVFQMTANGLGVGDTNGYINAVMIEPMSGGISPAGIPDSWKIAYFGSTTGSNTGDFEDYDGDGSVNYDEWRAGTEPNSAISVLAMTGETPSAIASQMILTWRGVSGITYSLQNSTNIATGWTTPHSGIPGVSPLNTYTVNASTVQGFWRVKVQ